MSRKSIILFLVLLIVFISLPSSFAYSNATDDEAYIEFDNENITITEGGSEVINGEIISGYMGVYDCEINYEMSYIDDSGTNRTYNLVYLYGDFLDYNTYNDVNLANLQGLSASDNPYKIVFNPVKDSYYDDYLYYYDNCEIAESWIYVTVQPDTYNPSYEGTLYVSTSGDDVSGDGSIDSPFASINKAIDENARLGGNYEVIVEEGTYYISEMQIRDNIAISGRGNVVLDGRGQNNAFYIIGADVTLNNLTITNVYRSGAAGAAISSTTSSTGDNNRLRIYNCTFANSTNTYGIIRYYGIVDIQNSTFINNHITSGTSGWSGIINIQGRGNVAYCNFINNTVSSTSSSANCGIYSTGAVTADYNYWGNNDRPTSKLASGGVTVNNWVILNISPSSVEDIKTSDEIIFTLDLGKYTDGTNVYDLPSKMPKITVYPTAVLGSFNEESIIVGADSVEITYTPVNIGNEVISFVVNNDNPYTYEFVVGEQYSGIVYVDTNGDDANRGSEDAPVKTLEKAVEIATAEGGSKEIIINEGTYSENNIKIDSDIFISASGDVILNSESLFNILSGNVNLQGLTLNITNSGNIITNKGNLIINYSSIYGDIVNDGNLTVTYSNIYGDIVNNGQATVDYNWWGSNDKPSNLDINYWVVMNVTPSEIWSNEETEILVSLNTVTDGSAVYNLENSLPTSYVTLKTQENTGSFNGASEITLKLIDGSATATFEGKNQSGTIVATIDNEEIIINVNKATLFWFINGTGYRTLEQAIAAAGYNDVIKGIPGVYIVEEQIDIGHRYFPAEPWEIIKHITITSQDPENPTIISGDNKSKLLSIDRGSSLILKDIILANANAQSSISNYAAAVFVQAEANLTIINSVFENNTAGYSGAIESWGNLIIKDSIFVNNKATETIGGAVTQDDSVGSITVENTIFINNYAKTYGGAVYASSGEGNSFVNCLFINNTAHCGGAMFINGDKSIITNSTFLNNVAADQGFDAISVGGAIYLSGNGITIDDSYFENNNAEDYGGALALGNVVSSVLTGDDRIMYYNWANINNSTFVNNNAGVSGGAIYNGINDGYAYTSVNDSTFVNNTAFADGGAIANNQGFVLINRTSFESNEAINGGAISNYGTYNYYDYINGVNVTIDQSTFTGNKAVNGASIFTETQDTKLHVYNSEFVEEEGEYGAIYTNGTSVISGNNFVNSADSAYYTPIYSTYRLSLANNTNNQGSIVHNKGWILVQLPVTEVITPNVTIAGDTVIISGTIVDDLGNDIDGKGMDITLINGTVVNVDVINGTYTYEYVLDSDIASGIYNISVKYDGNLYIVESAAVAQLTINDLTYINLTYTPINPNLYDKILIMGEVTSDSTSKVNGIVSIILPDGTTVNVTVVNGTFAYEWVIPDDFASGNYNIKAVFKNQSGFVESSIAVPITFSLIESKLSINVSASEVEAGESVIIFGTVVDGEGNPIEGEVVISLPGNKTVTVNAVDGKFNYTLNVPETLDAGNYSIGASFVKHGYIQSIEIINLVVTAKESPEPVDPTPDEPSTVDPTPEEPSINNPSAENLKSNEGNVADESLEGSKLTSGEMKKTGNPIAMLAVALICLLAMPLRRKL